MIGAEDNRLVLPTFRDFDRRRARASSCFSLLIIPGESGLVVDSVGWYALLDAGEYRTTTILPASRHRARAIAAIFAGHRTERDKLDAGAVSGEKLQHCVGCWRQALASSKKLRNQHAPLGRGGFSTPSSLSSRLSSPLRAPSPVDPLSALLCDAAVCNSSAEACCRPLSSHSSRGHHHRRLFPASARGDTQVPAHPPARLACQLSQHRPRVRRPSHVLYAFNCSPSRSATHSTYPMPPAL